MKAVLILLSMLMVAPVYAATDLQLMSTNPVCAHEGKTSAWCTYDDLVAVATANGMVDKINSQIDLATDPTKARIYVAYFSFSNKLVFRKLCEKAKLGVSIDFFLDTSYISNTLAADLRNGVCSKEEKALYDQAIIEGKIWPTLPNVKFHFLGKMDTTVSPIIWRLHHNKFLIVDSGESDEVKINFSSGNLSAFGTSLHFDHWVTATTQRTSNLFKTHMCVVQSMKVAIDPDQDGKDNDIDDPDVYRKTLDKCFAEINILPVETAIATESIAPLFAPNPENAIAETLINEIGKVKKGESITGAIQHFTHSGIAKALIAACKKGATVQMLMDDDIFTGESEVPGVAGFYNNVLDKTCLSIRFMQTNGAAFQLMHNKYLVLGNKRVFAGAGHFTYSAMRDNYENFYLMEGDSIRQQYKDLFDSMWKVSISKNEITPAEPQPEDGE